MLVFRFLFLICLFVFNYSYSQLECKNVGDFYKTHSLNSNRKRAGSNPLMDNYDVKYYNIDLNVSNTSFAIKGFVKMKAQVKKDGFNQVVLNLANAFTVDSVSINGKKVTYSKNGDELTINITSALLKNEYFESAVYYKGNGSSGADFPAGMNMGTYGSNSYLYTVSEPYHSYLWWPCKQDLLDKADSAAINITTKSTNLVASNGVLKKTTTIGSDKRFEWKTNYPIAYYLLTFSAGPYVEYKTYANPAGAKKPILIQAFVYDQAYLNANKSVIDQTALLIEKFSEKFGLYPFAEEKYGYYTAPFQYGALENQTMTMMNGFDFDLVAHELSHQWFGNNVTCTDWSQIWLHEGMADFCESIANELVYGESNRQTSISSSQGNVLASPTNCATIKNTNIPGNIFSKVNAYSKGATVMNMLRFEIGNDTVFYEILKGYQKKFSGRNANTDSLAKFIKGYTGKDFTYFFNQWIVGTGFPNYTFSSYQRGDTLYITSKQTTSSTLTPFYQMKLDFNLVNNLGGINYVSGYQNKTTEIFKFSVKNQRISSIQPNPKVWSLYKNNSGSQITTLSGDNFFTEFTFTGAVSSKMNETNIDVVMPFGTDLKSLKAIFKVSTGASVKIGSTIQTSGTTINTFTTTVTYSVIAQNGLVQNYKVNVTVAKNTEKAITSFSFNDLNPIVLAKINGDSITATVPYGTNRTNLIATFTVSAKALLKVGTITQVSGTTPNDFTNSLVYTVMAEDSSTQDYTVTVYEAPAPKSSEKTITSFSFNNLKPIVLAKINGDSITATVPYGTNRTNLIVTFTVSAKAILKVGTITQVSGTTPNDFTNSLVYTVMAEDSSTQDYSVTVYEAPAPKSSEKSIITFGFNDFKPAISAKINDTTITAFVPNGTNFKNLIATFTISPKATLKIGQATQISGVTVNDFSKALTYSVIAEDGSTQDYVVNVLDTTKNEGFISFELLDINEQIVNQDTTIIITVPANTDLTKLVASFKVQLNAVVTVRDLNQISGTTANDFTDTVTYLITLANGKTKYVKVIVKKEQLSKLTSLENKTQVYPNPTNGTIFVKGESGFLSILVKDVLGRIIYTKQLPQYNGEIFSFEFNELEDQILFVHLLNNSDESISKIEFIR